MVLCQWYVFRPLLVKNNSTEFSTTQCQSAESTHTFCLLKTEIIWKRTFLWASLSKKHNITTICLTTLWLNYLLGKDSPAGMPGSALIGLTGMVSGKMSKRTLEQHSERRGRECDSCRHSWQSGERVALWKKMTLSFILWHTPIQSLN